MRTIFFIRLAFVTFIFFAIIFLKRQCGPYAHLNTICGKGHFLWYLFSFLSRAVTVLEFNNNLKGLIDL